MHPIRTILVDDNAEFLNSAALFLSADSSIEIAGRALSGKEALELVATLIPDLVLMDLVIPDMDGLEITRRIKARQNAPCVVILTLHDNAEYRAAAQKVGADGFVAKSDFGTQLRPLVHHLLNNHDDLLQEADGPE